jgi:protein-S-isoprenylcysteine O-methyltransferase Ste14
MELLSKYTVSGGWFASVTTAGSGVILSNEPASRFPSNGSLANVSLLERRVNAGPGAEKEKSQKVIQFLAAIAFIAVFVFCAIDHRLRWSAVPPYVAIAGDVLVALGLVIIFVVFKENTFTSGIIEVEAGQKVISTGPYALVRHPMYLGALVMLLGVPLALGSWWGLFTIIPIALVIVWRLLDEEQFLAKNLSGYLEYRNNVRYRSVPFIW